MLGPLNPIPRRDFFVGVAATIALPFQKSWLPRRVSAVDALLLHRRNLLDGRPFLLMSNEWRLNAVEDDYEEVTAEELDDPDFLEDFAQVTFELWT